jgi:hypothetical protein
VESREGEETRYLAKHREPKAGAEYIFVWLDSDEKPRETDSYRGKQAEAKQ